MPRTTIEEKIAYYKSRPKKNWEEPRNKGYTLNQATENFEKFVKSKKVTEFLVPLSSK